MNLEQLLRLTGEKGRETWAHPLALGVALITAFLLVKQILGDEQVASFTTLSWCVQLATACTIVCTWFYTNRIIKPSKNRTGFGVAIRFEHADHAATVKTDLMTKLRNLLSVGAPESHFQLIEYPQHQIRDLERSNAAKFMHRTKCRFFIYGVARLRELDGAPIHVFDIAGMVTHGPITSERSQLLSNEFSRVLPSRLNVNKDKDFFAFEFTAQWFDIVARYIVGASAFLAGDLINAETMLLDLEHKLTDVKDRLPVITHIKQSIPARLQSIYQQMMESKSHQYFILRDKNLLNELDAILDKLQARNPNNYSAHLNRAITHFMLRRDIVNSRKEIEACSTHADSTWLFSRAFLEAYEGDLQAAYKTYRKAIECPQIDSTLPLQIEEFIQLVIDEEPDKTQLYFCLGLLNYRLKRDLDGGIRDLKKFIGVTDEKQYPDQHFAAKKWIGEIERQQRIK
jgi:tetratricopeptide (TPR) repeat protein